MFSKNDHRLFSTSLLLISIGFAAMAFDTAANGFGILTLWIAPPFLLIGFILPVVGILGITNLAPYFSFHELKLNKWKHIFGWIVFLISFFTYFLTLEPTASLWDCSEFIASAYKLEVPHTPGTPLSLLIGRIFTMLSFGDVMKVAWCINLMSGLFSALTVYLVYHVIYHFGENLKNESAKGNNLLPILSALCGSLCLTFSDTFWFSAVEAETYGAACFFLVLLVWLIIKGKDLVEPLRSRYLILIFYLGGISYCIHPMCLLALPILPFTWYVNNRTLNFRNVAVSVVTGLAIVFIINRFVAIGLFELAFSFDLFFVNSVHLPFYSGAAILLLVAIALFVFLLRRYVKFKTYTWSLVFLLLGFTPYLMLFIRSNHNPPIDETNPENLSMIKAYMNRESYGSRPLLFGPYFDAQVAEVSVEKTIYSKGRSQYEVSGTMSEYHYENSRSTIVPRIYSNDADHIESYRRWTGLKQNEKPRFTDNLKFMFRYQLGHMYMRYLMWNFAGRESDHQNSGWLKPWDSLSLAKAGVYNNKARNQYWMLPFALGILGMVVQYKRDQKGFFSTLIFFLITGIVLAVYLNSTPNEPRERDYIYVGSYIAFCIWIGLGISALYYILPRNRIALITIGMITIGIPAWLLFQNVDDHNRSGRTFQVDNARNLLNSCAPNSILFTGGDNDTFPLWYLQEVEGHRTDVRVMVLSYFNTDWYINQLRKPYYDSKPFALTLDQKDYRQYGPNDVLYVQESIKEGIDVKKYLKLLKEEHDGITMHTNTGDSYSILPSRTLKIKLDQKNSLNHTTYAALTALPQPIPEMKLRVTGNYLQKNALAVLDLMISNNLERPMYFNFTSLNTLGLDLSPYVIQEGNVYRLTSVENKGKDIRVNTELTYKNLTQKADYNNLMNPDLYFNYEDYQARMITPIRQSFNALAIAFLEEGNTAMAEKTLLFAVEKVYLNHLEPSYPNLQAADILLSLGRDDVAKPLCTSLFDFYYAQLQTDLNEGNEMDRLNLYLVKQSAEILSRMGEEKYVSKIEDLGYQIKPTEQ